MLKDLKESLNRWNAATTERKKLQHAYLAITVAVILIAGVVSLINPEQGRGLTYIALGSLLAFLGNALVWNLLNSAVLSKLAPSKKK